MKLDRDLLLDAIILFAIWMAFMVYQEKFRRRLRV